MTEDDPLRLKSSSAAPPELARALRALGKSDRDAARLARVADKLGALLDAPPPAPVSGLRKLLGSKLGIAGIVAGFAGLGLLAYELATSQPEPNAPAPAVVEPAPLPPAAVSPEPPPPPAAASPREPVAPAGNNGRRARRPARTSGYAPAASAAAAPESTPATAPHPAPASDATAAPRPTPTPTAHEEEPAEPEPATQQVAQRSELQLLFEARNVLPQQPAAALRLLDEHAARFGKGQLAPEREVLAIEALRKLGRDAEARQRLERFKAQYPRSIHLRRLQEKK